MLTEKIKTIAIIGAIGTALTASAVTITTPDNGDTGRYPHYQVEQSIKASADEEQPKVEEQPEAQQEAIKEEPAEIVSTETKTVKIPFTTKQVNDNSLAKGTTKVTQKGVEGERTEYYTVTTREGVEISRTLERSEVSKEPVEEIVAVGTYVKPTTTLNCANGTYKNSAGQTVCRPSTKNTGGATAICRDGTYSYSKNRRGTCSHHGGVKKWL